MEKLIKKRNKRVEARNVEIGRNVLQSILIGMVAVPLLLALVVTGIFATVSSINDRVKHHAPATKSIESEVDQVIYLGNDPRENFIKNKQTFIQSPR